MRRVLGASALFLVLQCTSIDAREYNELLENCPSSLLSTTAEFSAFYASTAFSDQAAACEAFHALSDELWAAGFTSDEASEAVESAWLTLRQDIQAGEPLNSVAVYQSARNLGLLVVESIPAGATVTIRGSDVSCKTKCDRWLPEETYTIIISMEGYVTTEDVANVRAMEHVRIARELDPVGATPGSIDD